VTKRFSLNISKEIECGIRYCPSTIRVKCRSESSITYLLFLLRQNLCSLSTVRDNLIISAAQSTPIETIVCERSDSYHW